MGQPPARRAGADPGRSRPLVWVATGAWIFYNTNVLNRYVTQPEHDQRDGRLREDAAAVREACVQPRVADVTLNVELFPRAARAVTHGSYTLVNRSTQPIPRAAPAVGGEPVAGRDRVRRAPRSRPTTRASTTASTSSPRRCSRASSARSGFTTTLEQRGFANGAPVDAGGAQRLVRQQLRDRAVGRLRARGPARGARQAPQVRPAGRAAAAQAGGRVGAPVQRARARQRLGDVRHHRHHRRRPDADRARARRSATPASASDRERAPHRALPQRRADQPVLLDPVGPLRHPPRRSGTRRRRPTSRRTTSTWPCTTRPATSSTSTACWTRCSESLALFSKEFSPYQFKQARIIEFPAYAGVRAVVRQHDPVLRGHRLRPALHQDPTKIDVATYVTAHEIGHQWWGHQLVPADQQGASMLVETFAQYSALLVMEQHYGKEQVRRFLKYELDRYLRSRGGAVLEELPLEPRREPGLHLLPQGLGGDVLGQGGARARRWSTGRCASCSRSTRSRARRTPTRTDFLKLLRAEAGPAERRS